ncbi:MAG: hypothetical protein ACYC6N_16815 [Pirellulaceae bacterium]
MRQFFFLSVVIGAVLAGLVYFVWSIVSTLYRDWEMGRDVDEIKAVSEARRRQRQEEAARRLDNGCDHRFGETFAGFPPDACYQCGLARERPPGPCDHVWRIANEAVPCSYCEICGKRYVSPRVAEG